MPPRRRKPDPVPERTRALPPGGLLDWSGSEHFAQDALPCWHCGAPTHMRDDRGIPADKVCAERALAEIDQIVQAHAQALL
ncbi:hypothetical protein [Streptomyces sp. NPDC058548]|uniref:hypothetical protein n=1 Tax=Streptomyces sp. NPDC058548 TaxID=3346545 RepID=UPI003656AAA4